MMYLGLPLDSSFIFNFVCNGIVEKIDQGLASCKNIYLSKGGRKTQIEKAPFLVCQNILCQFSLYLY